jgi:hypothetical protein
MYSGKLPDQLQENLAVAYSYHFSAHSSRMIGLNPLAQYADALYTLVTRKQRAMASAEAE